MIKLLYFRGGVILSDLKRCPKCNSEMAQCVFESIPMNVKSVCQKLYVDKTTEIMPYVCIQCGYTEFYAKYPQKLINL